MTDKDYISLAIELSEKADWPYGAIIVKGDKIIGRSDARAKVKNTPYAHAEMIAIEDALDGIFLQPDFSGATLYASCEPCVMCMGAIFWAQISRIVYAATIEDSKQYVAFEIPIRAQDLVKKAKNRNIEVIAGLERGKAVEVMRNWNISFQQ
ncbi:MAG: nucleoside deaminase [Firmicutes bacterium]|nr:nucleoside deaminase [Bacillota bacterium]